MVSAVVTFGMIFLLLASGRIYEGIKKLITLIVDILLKIANFCGLGISKTERRIHTSKEFKKTFKDIKVVKKSKENNKIKPSINLFALILLMISVTLIICNLEVVSGNAISIWLFDINPVPMLIATQRNMDMTFTAILFSFVTFSISKLLSQWKDTKKYRDAKKQMKQKKHLTRIMTSKDLLDVAKMKDRENYDRLIKHTDDSQEDNQENV